MDEEETVNATEPAAVPAVPPIAPARPVVAAPAVPATSTEEAPKVVQGRGGPMTEEAIRERVARERRKFLKEMGLPDDPEQAKTTLAQMREKDTVIAQRESEIAAYRAKEEEAARAAMTDQEKLQADLAALRAENESLKAQLKEKDTTVLMEKQRAKVVELGAKYKVKSKYVDYMFRDLVAHWAGLTQKDKLAFTPVKLDQWARAWVRDNPGLLDQPEQVASTTPKEEPKPAPAAVRRPIGSKRPPPPPAPARATNQRGVNHTGKSVMQMNPKELDTHMQSTLGIRKSW